MFNYDDFERRFVPSTETSNPLPIRRNVIKMTDYMDRYIELEFLLSYLDWIDQFLPLTGWWPAHNGAIRSTKEHEAFYSALRD